MRLSGVIYCLFMLLGMSSCIQDYDIEFDEHKILSLNAEINPDEEIKLLLALPNYPGEDNGAFDTPSDAIVTVFEDGKLFETLTFQSGNGIHGVYVSDKKPKPDKNYQVEVRYAGFPVVRARQFMHDYPKVDNITFDKELAGLTDSATVAVQINIRENERNNRSFAVRNILEVIRSNMMDSMYPRIDTLLYYVSPVSKSGFYDHRGYWVCAPGSSPLLNYHLLFQGMSSILKMDMILSVRFFITIDELSESAYLYRESYRKKDMDNYGEPSLVYSNVENGLGIFSTISTEVRQFKIK